MKIAIAILLFGVTYNYFNNQNLPGSQSQASYTGTAKIFAIVISCDWLNVRSTPSSVNKNNIIEAICANTKVEIIERTNNGWVKIRYNNDKTGFVHKNFLSN